MLLRIRCRSRARLALITLPTVTASGEVEVDVEALEALLRAGLPARYGQARVELAERGLDLAPDGRLSVRLRLHNDATGEYGEQTVQLVPAGQNPERAHAYVQAWARSLPSLLACVIDRTGGRSVAPSMLEFSCLVLEHGQARTAAPH